MNQAGWRRMGLSPPLVIAAAYSPQNWADNHLRPLLLALAGGFTVTLPRATGSGLRLNFWVSVTAVAAPYLIKVSNATDVMQGTAWQTQDAADTAQAWEAGATADTITLDGSTTGGLIGDRLELLDAKSGFWFVQAFLQGTGTEATPFSATVS